MAALSGVFGSMSQIAVVPNSTQLSENNGAMLKKLVSELHNAADAQRRKAILSNVGLAIVFLLENRTNRTDDPLVQLCLEALHLCFNAPDAMINDWMNANGDRTLRAILGSIPSTCPSNFIPTEGHLHGVVCVRRILQLRELKSKQVLNDSVRLKWFVDAGLRSNASGRDAARISSFCDEIVQILGILNSNEQIRKELKSLAANELLMARIRALNASKQGSSESMLLSMSALANQALDNSCVSIITSVDIKLLIGMIPKQTATSSVWSSMNLISRTAQLLSLFSEESSKRDAIVSAGIPEAILRIVHVAATTHFPSNQGLSKSSIDKSLHLLGLSLARFLRFDNVRKSLSSQGAVDTLLRLVHSHKHSGAVQIGALTALTHLEITEKHVEDRKSVV